MIDFGIKITVRDQSLPNVRSRENAHTLHHARMQRLSINESKVSLSQFLVTFAAKELYRRRSLFFLQLILEPFAEEWFGDHDEQ